MTELGRVSKQVPEIIQSPPPKHLIYRCPDSVRVLRIEFSFLMLVGNVFY